MFFVRMKYYYAWVMADVVFNASGFGFSGYSADGEEKWDLFTNVDIWGVETAISWKDCLESWNRVTMHWLRRVAYERTPDRYPVLATYLLSAWWHGFFPGYYSTFSSGALFTATSRTVRRHLRPYFLGSRWTKFFYDLLTFVTMKLALTWLGFTFFLLHWNLAIRAYQELYFYMIIGSVILLILLPYLLPKKNEVKDD